MPHQGSKIGEGNKGAATQEKRATALKKLLGKVIFTHNGVKSFFLKKGTGEGREDSGAL